MLSLWFCFLCREDSQRIVDVILSRREDFSVFDTYISEYDRSMSLLEESCRNNMAFASVVKKFEVKNLTDRLVFVCSHSPCVYLLHVGWKHCSIPRILFKEETVKIFYQSHSKLGFSFHVCGVKVKPFGCSPDIEPAVFLGTRSAALHLDFVTQLPRGNNSLSEPSQCCPSPWDWPLRCHACRFYTHSTTNTLPLSNVGLFILDPPWRAGKWDLWDQNSAQAHSKTTAVILRLCA